MNELIMRLHIEQDIKDRLLQTKRSDQIANLLLQRIDREITKIKRLIDEKSNKSIVPAYTRRAAFDIKKDCVKYRAYANRYYNTIFAIPKKASLYTERTAQ